MKNSNLILIGLCIVGLAWVILWYLNKSLEEEVKGPEQEPKDTYPSVSGGEIKRTAISVRRASLTEILGRSLLMSSYIGRPLPYIPPKISTEPTEITFYSASRFTTSPRVRTVRIAPEVLRRISEARFTVR